MSSRHTCVKLAISEQHWWCMGQYEEIHFGRRLGPDHAKDTDMYKKTVSGDSVGDPMKGHFWTSLNNCDEAHCDPQLVFGSAIAAHRIPREVRFE